MKQQLEEIKKSALDVIENLKDMQQVENARIKYLGKKGELTAILKQMGKLSAEERPVIGQLANEIRAELDKKITDKTKELKEAALTHYGTPLSACPP